MAEPTTTEFNPLVQLEKTANELRNEANELKKLREDGTFDKIKDLDKTIDEIKNELNIDEIKNELSVDNLFKNLNLEEEISDFIDDIPGFIEEHKVFFIIGSIIFILFFLGTLGNFILSFLNIGFLCIILNKVNQIDLLILEQKK